jgi:alpha-L-arabinofuranosidase
VSLGCGNAPAIPAQLARGGAPSDASADLSKSGAVAEAAMTSAAKGFADANADAARDDGAGPSTLLLTIDPSRRGAPISPYIYGQFIEHLGRSIYGGIWAEMLEDRKFYFPITADYRPYRSLEDTPYPVVGASPWEIMGASSQVTMVTAGAFVGAHSPRIRAGAGVRQRDLAVIGGQSYSGHVWVRGASSQRTALDVTLVWGEGPTERSTTRLDVGGGEFASLPFRFVPRASSSSAQLEMRAVGGDVVIGTASLMPSDNIHGLRRDTLALLKQLRGTVYRWPGGNFVSGYEWRDGIGDRDRRPPRANPAWTGVEHNDFGTDEFLAFCREVGAEPAIAVNTGFGDAYSAAQWVEYCNGSAQTLAGSWRAKNGHPSAYGVKFWCVGNEMFGSWQLGYMKLEQYSMKHNRVAEAMRAVDPRATLIGVGDIDGVHKLPGPGGASREVTWSQGMLERSGDDMDLISEHLYEGRTPWNKDGRADLLTHVAKLRNAIRRKAERHRALQSSLPNLKGKIVPIAMDEWNYWHRDYAYGELGCVYDLADGLGVAAGLHEYFRQTDIVGMAFYAQTVNVLGCVKTTKTAAELETTGLVLELYRDHFGEIPLVLEPSRSAADLSAALTRDGRTLTVAVVNPTSASLELRLTLENAVARGKASSWLVSGPDEFAHNTPGKPRQVNISHVDGLDPNTLSAPPLSCTVFVLSLE